MNQANSYRSKSWGYIVAPTNRRPFGFDWQSWGRLDALESLADAKLRYGIDPTRVYLTGHSMGGMEPGILVCIIRGFSRSLAQVQAGHPL